MNVDVFMENWELQKYLQMHVIRKYIKYRKYSKLLGKTNVYLSFILLVAFMEIEIYIDIL